jgi:hypothetical protein
MNDPKQPLTMGSLLHEARQEFGSPDRGLLRTIRLLATAPGETLRELFAGGRPELTRPVRFFLFVFTLYALTYVSTGAMTIIAAETNASLVAQVSEILSRQGLENIVSADEITRANPITYYLQYPLVYEILAAILLWFASWPAFARSGLSAAERLTATLYLYGMFNLAQIPLVPLVLTGHFSMVKMLLPIVLLAYLSWTSMGLLATRRRTSWLRGVAWWLCLQLLAAVVVGAGIAKIGYDVAHKAGQNTHDSTPARP